MSTCVFIINLPYLCTYIIQTRNSPFTFVAHTNIEVISPVTRDDTAQNNQEVSVSEILSLLTTLYHTTWYMYTRRVVMNASMTCCTHLSLSLPLPLPLPPSLSPLSLPPLSLSLSLSLSVPHPGRTPTPSCV